jgi:hypothetical protein
MADDGQASRSGRRIARPLSGRAGYAQGYGPSSAIVCNGSGECWHSVQRYDYPQGVQVEVHPFDWSWNDGQNYAWREHPGPGYWQNGEWQIF